MASCMQGSIGSFDNTTEMSVESYGELMTSFIKPGGRIPLSIFDCEHSEHPSIYTLAVTEDEVTTILSNFSPP